METNQSQRPVQNYLEVTSNLSYNACRVILAPSQTQSTTKCVIKARPRTGFRAPHPLYFQHTTNAHFVSHLFSIIYKCPPGVGEGEGAPQKISPSDQSGRKLPCQNGR